MIASPLVAVWRGKPEYARTPPFHPSERYPEYPFSAVNAAERNPAYEGVREAFGLLGLDAGRFGARDWNPLGDLVRPGDTVVLKPNLIRESNLARPESWQEVITHGSVLRAVIDYVFIALRGSGRIVVADGPQTDSAFEEICRRTGLREVVAFFGDTGIGVELLDLRRELWHQRGSVINGRSTLPGDPAGYTTVDLGEASEFAGYGLSGRLYGADYDVKETASYHTNGRHAYVLCRTAMDADVLIDVPKLKTHKKVGVTICLKNMVGINGHRNCLPHHTIGTPAQNGDEFAAADLPHVVQSRAIVAFKRTVAALGGTAGAWARGVMRMGAFVFGETDRVIRSGNWHGNDTAWRMVLDLNKVLFHFNGAGARREKPLRFLAVVDGIVAGEGNGPASPDPSPAGVIAAGFNPVAVDAVGATLMGFDWRRIPLIANAWTIAAHPLAEFEPADVRCVSNIEAWNGSIDDLLDAPHLGMRPQFGWEGHIERRQRVTV